MLEIYNETVRDLLGVKDKAGDLPKLDIRIVAEGVRPSLWKQAADMNAQHDVVLLPVPFCALLLLKMLSKEYDVSGLTLVDITSLEDVISTMNQGKQNR